MSDNKQNAFQAGQAAGKTEEKANTLADKVKGAAGSAQETAQQGGQKIGETATGAVNVVKEKTGMK